MLPAYLVTGSSGFIGSHLCAALGSPSVRSSLYGVDTALPAAEVPYTHVPADIRISDNPALESLRKCRTIIHLAARAEVVTAFADLGDLSLTNVNGTANLLATLNPRTFVFASSSAVYGNSGKRGVPATFRHVKPVGTYGISKAFGELICTDWCRERGGSAVAFRFGNVVGARCRGFIPFLVQHALRHPQGDVPALCRGKGLILRDYVPVEYIVSLLLAAAKREWKTGESRAFNAGTGRGMTNGQVGAIVARTLRRKGYSLNIRWDSPLEPGESKSIVLDMGSTVKTFQLRAPSQASVTASIEQSALWWLAHPEHLRRTTV